MCRPDQRRGGLRLGYHGNVVDPGVLQCVLQLVSFGLIRPTQPGSAQPVVFAGQ
ncbi:Uncharacterised protein [Mycobacterium tuberculosis]|nr:Uncharacterised protein [Mycobacterium tuberculosis]